LAGRWVLALVALGVGVRAAGLLLAGDLEPYGDESHYLYLALAWNRFGFYSDCAQYLWPPGYPFLLAAGLKAFGSHAIFAIKLVQVLISGVNGSVIMRLAGRLFGPRAAFLAGLLWALHLPLIGFTHYLWPETLYLTLFLPAFYWLVKWWQEPDRPSAANRWLVGAGLLIGLSLLVKEAGVLWCAVVAVLIFCRDLGWSLRVGWSRALLFLLSAGAVLTPWTLRNFEVYGRLAPAGATLGQNVYWGVNGFYLNFDYPPSVLARLPQINPWVHRRLLQPAPPNWERSAALNVVDQSADNVRRGLAFARRHPGFVLRSRLKKLADWATPLSFFVRHYAWQRYHGALTDPVIRRPLLVIAIALPMLILASAWPGLTGLRDPGGARSLLIWTLAYFLAATALINGMSRYRTCIEPVLIVLAAGFLSGAARPWGHRPGLLGCIGGWVVLAGLWGINLPEVLAVLKLIW